MFLEKCSIKLLKKNYKFFFQVIIMVRFGETSRFYAAEKTYKNLGCQYL